MYVPLVSVASPGLGQRRRALKLEDAGMRTVIFHICYKLLPMLFWFLCGNHCLRFVLAVCVGLLGYLLDFDAINIFTFCHVAAYLVSYGESWRLEGRRCGAYHGLQRPHGMQLAVKTTHLVLVLRMIYNIQFFGTASKALQDLILDTFSALSAAPHRAPSPNHPEVSCGSLNLCFKCLCSFVHNSSLQEEPSLPCLSVVASYSSSMTSFRASFFELSLEFCRPLSGFVFLWYDP